MKAIMTYDFGDMRLEDVPEPQVTSGNVKIRMEMCQPSVTDALRFHAQDTNGVDRVKRLLEQKRPYMLFGHEFCAEVVEVGQGVEGFSVGDRVSSRAEIPCGTCEACRAGDFDSCGRRKRIGVDSEGCFAEYVVLPPTALEKINYEVSASEAACLQPLSSVVACVEEAGLRLGDTVVVLGQGVMGLCCSQIARVSGAGMVIGTEVRPEALALAKEFGVEHVIDAAKEDSLSRIMELTGGKGADIVFECAGGSPQQGLAGARTLDLAMKAVRNRGKVIEVAHPYGGKTLPFSLSLLRAKAIKFIFPSPATSAHFRHGFDLIRTRRINVSRMITHVLEGLENTPKAFEITGNKGEYKSMNPAQVRIWRSAKDAS